MCHLPYKDMIMCLKECPGAIFTLLYIWENRIGNHSLIRKLPPRSKKFRVIWNLRKDIFQLRNARIIGFVELDDSFQIYLKELEIKAEGKTLC